MVTRTWCPLGLFAALLWGGCPTADDDSAAADDDTTVDDDTTGDDDSTPADDDTSVGDDDTTAQDWDQASVPDFADCSGNAFKVMLGDGTVLGPFTGEFGLPASYANNNGQWALRMGPSATLFAALQGNNSLYVVDQDIVIVPSTTTPAPGSISLQVFVDGTQIGDAPPATGGAFGFPTTGADPRVGGQVNFSSLPLAGATGAGRFSAVLQSPQQAMLGNIVLLGVRGCFSIALSPTDSSR